MTIRKLPNKNGLFKTVGERRREISRKNWERHVKEFGDFEKKVVEEIIGESPPETKNTYRHRGLHSFP